MERRVAHRSVRAWGAACVSGKDAHALRRSTCGFSVPGTVLPGADGGLAANRIRAAFAALHPRRVQPLKAVPLSGDGRRPRASRARGYEPRPRAPRQPAWRFAPFRPS